MDALKPILMAIFLLQIHCVAASDTSLNALLASKLIPINHKTAMISQPLNKGIILSFYAPDCAWCERQIKSLNKFQKECESAWATSLIGIKGNKQLLNKLLRKTHNTLPAFIATSEFLTQVPTLEATPLTLFIDSNRKILAVKRGYVDLQNQTSISCDSRLQNER